MVGIAVSASESKGPSSSGTKGVRLLFNLNGAARGGGGGSMADCGSCNCSGVFGSWPSAPRNSNSGMSIDSDGRGRAISAVGASSYGARESVCERRRLLGRLSRRATAKVRAVAVVLERSRRQARAWLVVAGIMEILV